MIINIEKSMLAHNEFPGELVQKSKEILAYPKKTIGGMFEVFRILPQAKLVCF